MKCKNEKDTRYGILTLAREQGCEPECRKIFDLYDGILKRTMDPIERRQIASLALVELHRLLNVQSGLAILTRDPNTGKVIGGEQLIPDEPEKIKINYDV